MSTLKVVPDQSTDLVDLVAEEVRAHMARRRVTQVQLAEMLGIKQVSVSERLRGKTPFRLEEIQTIAEAFGIHPAALLGGSAPSPSGPVTGAYDAKSNTLREDNVRKLRVNSHGLGDDLPGAMRTTRTAAA